MAHHSDSPFGEFPNFMDEFRKSMPQEHATRIDELLKKDTMKDFGATKNYPEGKLKDSDEGEIKFGITHAEGRVIMNFNTPVKWIGFTKEQAIQVAETLLKHSKEII